MTNIDPKAVMDIYPRKEVTSLRDVQALYGAINTATKPIPLGQEDYAPYFDPSELDSYVADGDGSNYLVTVDLRVPDGQQDPVYEGVSVNALSDGMKPRLGLVRYPWKGPDHSVTRCGKKSAESPVSDPDKKDVRNYCVDMFDQWAGSDPVQDVADSHSDGWLLEVMQELGESVFFEKQIETDVEQVMDSSAHVVVTVRVTGDESVFTEQPSNSNRWYYPGEIPVFNEAAKARKGNKIVSKQLKNAESVGDAAGLISMEDKEVCGTSEDPFEFYTVQHTEKFSELYRTESWRSQPVGKREALLIDNSDKYLNACETSRNGVDVMVHLLPYFTELTLGRVTTLVGALNRLAESDWNEFHPIRGLLESIQESERATAEDLDSLRYYVIVHENDRGDVYVYHEIPDASLLTPLEIGDAHEETLHGDLFTVSGFKKSTRWNFLTETTDRTDVTRGLMTGQYLFETFPLPEKLVRDDKNGDDDMVSDNALEQAYTKLLTDTPINWDWLLNQYVTRLTQEQQNSEDRADASDSGGSKSVVPVSTLLKQITQLSALLQVGAVSPPDIDEAYLQSWQREGNVLNLTTDLDMGMSDQQSRQHSSGTNAPGEQESYDPIVRTAEEVAAELDCDSTTDDSLPVYKIREARLESFLQSRPELAENAERRSAFLLGVLIGQLSWLQETDRNINQTFAIKYPSKDIRPSQLTQLVPELLSKDQVYAGDYDYSMDGSCFPETTERVSAAFTQIDPAGLGLSIPDLRFYISLGVSYGNTSHSRAMDIWRTLNN